MPTYQRRVGPNVRVWAYERDGSVLREREGEADTNGLFSETTFDSQDAAETALAAALRKRAIVGFELADPDRGTEAPLKHVRPRRTGPPTPPVAIAAVRRELDALDVRTVGGVVRRIVDASRGTSWKIGGFDYHVDEEGASVSLSVRHCLGRGDNFDEYRLTEFTFSFELAPTDTATHLDFADGIGVDRFVDELFRATDAALANRFLRALQDDPLWTAFEGRGVVAIDVDPVPSGDDGEDEPALDD